MTEQEPKPQLPPEFLEKWRRAVESQHWAATHPRPQREAEEFQRKISAISVLEMLQEMTI